MASIGIRYLCPITPVLMTSVESWLPTLWSVVFAMLAASSKPPMPVTALAHPELIITLRRPALALVWSTFRLKVTGAAWNLFLVNTAAAEHGNSEVTKARSGLLVLPGLTPTKTPEARKPLGYVPDVGTYFILAWGIAPPRLDEYERVNLIILAYLVVVYLKLMVEDQPVTR